MTETQIVARKALSNAVLVVLVAGSLIAMISFGARSGFGFFLEPMTVARDWSRETFSLALALQNLAWGIGVPIAGAVADRFGARKVVIGGALTYGMGIWGMSIAETGLALHIFAGVVTGLGIAFTSFSLVMATMAKVSGPERRSMVLGLGTAAGSFGMVVFSPMSQGFIAQFGWQSALFLLGAITLVMVPLALILPTGTAAVGEAPSNQTLGEALKEALAHRGYILLTTGFFVCGFHVAFITVHFPAYIRDLGLEYSVAAMALALIGAFNIAGSFLSGIVGQKYSKKLGLSWLYLARAIAIAGLLMADKTPATIYIFSAVMGILWLSTIPLTTGIVAQVFGARYLATLFGIVFLSHQLGSFIGVWLGGYLHDTIGNYDPVWWLGIALGLAAAIIHLPINERPLARLGGARA